MADFDLDAIVNEASGKPFTFTLGGEQFTMRSPEDADWLVMLRRADGVDGTQAFVAELLGDDFGRFRAHRVPLKALNALLEACRQHYGVSPGESPASTGS